MSLHPFDLSLLVWPGLAIFLTVFGVTLAVLRRPDVAIAIAMLKAVLFIAYFGWFFDGTFTYLDDWSYLKGGADIRDEGVSLLNFLDNLPLLVAVGDGEHFLYYLFNATALDWFGPGYFAPVALNVIITALVALIGARLAATESLISLRNVKLFFIVLIIHPDLTAWSTLVNGKDTLVLLLHVLLLYSISLFLHGHRASAIMLGGLSVTILLFLRFYVPLMFAVTFIMSFVLRMRGAARWRVLLTALVILFSLVGAIGLDAIAGALDSLREHFVNPVFGLVRFMVTPVPFNTEASFAFLDLPSLLHWLLMPALLLGARTVYRMNTPFSRFLILYVLVFTALYSVYGELQGPRHRVQLDYVIALFQFVGFCVLFPLIKTKSTLPGASPVRPQPAEDQ